MMRILLYNLEFIIVYSVNIIYVLAVKIELLLILKAENEKKIYNVNPISIILILFQNQIFNKIKS